MKLHLILSCTLTCFALLAPPAQAQVPNLVNYQGRIAVGTTNFNGSGQFKFALVNAAGTTTWWSNDGSSTAGSQPAAAVSLTVIKGLYSVLLGDTSLANMTAIPSTVWSNADVRLRIWFNDGTTGFQLLTPDQRLAPGGYIADGAVSNAKLTTGIDAGKITTGTLGPVSGANLTSLNASNLSSGTINAARLADGSITAAKLLTVTRPFTSFTFYHPDASGSEFFGSAIAVLGTGKVVVGAPFDSKSASNAGAAFLFSANGDFLQPVTNPSPVADGTFGSSISSALFGDSHVIGSPGARKAVLSIESGGTFTLIPPAGTSNDGFGTSVAYVPDAGGGASGALVGAPYDNVGGGYTGAVYLFAGGTLVRTFNRPSPQTSAYFGYSVVMVGTDKVLIGAPYDDTGATDAGAAYLFSLTGTLLRTFTAPATQANANFGWSVAAEKYNISDGIVNEVFIGAPNPGRYPGVFGKVYRFNTGSGTPLTTFSSPRPVPSIEEEFGTAIVPLGAGSNRLLVGSPGYQVNNRPNGAAYLFDAATGLVVTTYENPAPATTNPGDSFGSAVAVSPHTSPGSGYGLVIGARRNGDFGSSEGAAYAFYTGLAETYTPGLMAEGVRAGSITTADLADHSVSASKISESVLSGLATLTAGNTFSGNQTFNASIGIGTNTPLSPLDIQHAIRLETDTTDIASGNLAARLFFSEDQTNNFGFSLLYNGRNGFSPIFGGTQIGAVSNAFSILRHDNNAAGSTVLRIDRTSGDISVNGTISAGGFSTGGSITATGELTCEAVNLTSDRNAKEQFKPVNAREVLAKVASLPISEWQYKSKGDESSDTPRHLGPMAQDFRAAFALGHDEKHIATVDADGVALAAIQGLNAKVEEELQGRDTELGRLKEENRALADRLTAIEFALKLKGESGPSGK